MEQDFIPKWYMHQQILAPGAIIIVHGNEAYAGAYRILSFEDGAPVVKLLRMSGLGTATFRRSIASFADPVYTFEGTTKTGHFARYDNTVQPISGASLDDTVNAWYSSLPNGTFKNSIVSRQVGNQGGYVITNYESAQDASKLDLKIKVSNNEYCYCYKVTSVGSSAVNRYAHALSIQEIKDLFNSNEIDGDDLYNMVGPAGYSTYIALRDASDYGYFNPADNGLCCAIDRDGQTGTAKISAQYGGQAYPVFSINLASFKDWETYIPPEPEPEEENE